MTRDMDMDIDIDMDIDMDMIYLDQDWLWAEDMLYTYFRGILIKRKQEYGEEEIIKQKAKLR